jgi:hypothetical protein
MSMMELGFETIANALMICHDRVPILVTDPWVTRSAYFGSWGMSHQIPPEQMESILSSKYTWISHGHPDHLSPASLDLMRSTKILLPDHYGGRIREGLVERGFDVTVLKDRRWYPLSDRIRILTIADYNQDAILLVDIDGTLLINLNDATDFGWGEFVKKTIRKYQDTFLLLQTRGTGDPDMINCWTEDGVFIEPRAAKRKTGGQLLSRSARQWQTKYCVPFSTMHVYQRADSVWANKYDFIRVSEYPIGWNAKTELLPAFIRYDVPKASFEKIDPPENTLHPVDPKEFGDDWGESLDNSDKQKITQYFKAIQHLEEFLDFVRVRIGGQEHVVSLGKRHFDRGLTFETPRHSFMKAIEWEVFDDLLNGNFMKTTVHGSTPRLLSQPDFVPYVAKYADNGQAKTREEVEAYFRNYMQRAPMAYFKNILSRRVTNFVRFSLSEDSSLYSIGLKSYFWLKGAGFSS